MDLHRIADVVMLSIQDVMLIYVLYFSMAFKSAILMGCMSMVEI